MMNKNVKIAKELVKLAKDLVATGSIASQFNDDKKAILNACRQHGCTCRFNETDNELEATITTDERYGYDEFTIVVDLGKDGKPIYGIEGDGISQEYGLYGGKINNLNDALSCIFESDDKEMSRDAKMLYDDLKKFCDKLIKKCRYLTNADEYFDTDNFNDWASEYTMRLTDDRISSDGSAYITYGIVFNGEEGWFSLSSQVTRNGNSTAISTPIIKKWSGSYEDTEQLNDALSTFAHKINAMHTSEMK